MPKPSVYISQNANSLTISRKNVDKLKQALVQVFRDYKALRGQQQRLDASMNALADIIWWWHIRMSQLPKKPRR